MNENIIISKAKYLKLLLSAEKLTRLENGGVDNWEGYDESLNLYYKPDLDEFEISEIERILKLDRD